MTNATESAVRREADPVCGMNVRVDVAVADGLVTEHDGHAYYFCRAKCRDAFVAAPGQYIASHMHAAAHAADTAIAGQPQIDEGMRRWYESCSCCLSDAYPEVKAALDAERQLTAQPSVPPGICEVAEAAETAHS